MRLFIHFDDAQNLNLNKMHSFPLKQEITFFFASEGISRLENKDLKQYEN